MRPNRLNCSSVFMSLTLAALSTLSTPAAADAAEATVPDGVASRSDGQQSGNASFYSHRLTGRKTASGDRYDPTQMTAAHRTLPMGTQLRVTNPRNDRSVIVTVNDRGRLPKGRVVDVSSAAADALDMKKSGVTKVHTRIVDKAGAQVDAVKPDADAAGNAR